MFIKLSAQLCQENSGVEVDEHKPTSTKAINTREELHTPGSKGEKVQEHPKPPRQEPAKTPIAETRFAHRTKFDLLTDTVETVDSDETEIGGISGLSLTEEDGDIAQKVKGELIPRFGSAFWNIYGNKLRVFGTEERVCVLGSTARPKKIPVR